MPRASRRRCGTGPLADLDQPGHVVFVGMMGSGKSTVGRKVANRLGRDFVDTDDAVVTGSGRAITDWFAAGDEVGFRDAEERVLAEVLGRDEPVVVATGGGIVLREANRNRLRSAANTVVWLRASPAFLAGRVAQGERRTKRPLLADDPLAALERLEGERRALYAEVADLIIDIEPTMRQVEKPRKRLAALVVEALGPQFAGTAASGDDR